MYENLIKNPNFVLILMINLFVDSRIMGISASTWFIAVQLK